MVQIHSISALVFGHSVRRRSLIALYRRIMFFCYLFFLFFCFRSVGIPSSVLKNRAFEVFPVEDESFLPFCSVGPLELRVCVLEFLVTFQNLMSASC